MKKNRIFAVVPLIAFLIAAVSCEKQVILSDSGAVLEKGSLDDKVSIYFNTDAAVGKTVELTLDAGEGSRRIGFNVRSSQPLPLSQKITFAVDNELLQDYPSETEYNELPCEFYAFDGGSVTEIRTGKSETGKGLTVYSVSPLGNALAPGRYLLPVRISASLSEIKEPVAYIDVTVRHPYTDPDGVKLYDRDDCITVFYINTSVFDPRLALDHVYYKNDRETKETEILGYGNIIVLRSTLVDYNASTGKVSVKPSNDMRHVIDHYGEIVRPVQESGRKVCLCIEGGGRGIGFCNFTDEQIADFVNQVKLLVETYGFDGVNLWDRNSGYGRPGTPEMNTMSYPKFIKALREALGQDRLITLSDFKEPTEYFNDTEATGGIKVGEYIDYAWSGYVDGYEAIQIVDPWHQGEPCVSSKYPRQPIAGLAPEKYGCIHCTWYTSTNFARVDLVREWVKSGFRNSGISVYYDIRSTLQDEFETVTSNQPTYLLDVLYPMSNFSKTPRLDNPNSPTGYGKWLKEW